MSQLDNFLDVAEFVMHDNSSIDGSEMGAGDPFVQISARHHSLISPRPESLECTLFVEDSLFEQSMQEQYERGLVPLSPERTFEIHDWQRQSDDMVEKEDVTSTQLNPEHPTEMYQEYQTSHNTIEGISLQSPLMPAHPQTLLPAISTVIISLNKDRPNNTSHRHTQQKDVSPKGDRHRTIFTRGRRLSFPNGKGVQRREPLRPNHTPQEPSIILRRRGRPKTIKKYNTGIKRRGRKPKINNGEFQLRKRGRPSIRKHQTEDTVTVVKPFTIPLPIPSEQIRYVYKRKVGRPRKNEILIEQQNKNQ